MDRQIVFRLQHPTSWPLPKPTKFNNSVHEDGNNTCLCGAFSTHLLSTTHFGYVSFHVHIIYVEINIYLFFPYPLIMKKHMLRINLTMAKFTHVKINKMAVKYAILFIIMGEYMMQHI
jgi:hypothetical protein